MTSSTPEVFRARARRAEPPEAVAAIIQEDDRVLQIGPGTSAARLVERSRRTVLSLQDSRAGVEDVRAALGPAGRNAGIVDAVPGDLFDGRPDAGPFDVVVVTAAVRGLSPHWLDQLAPGGVVVAPVALGGLHPWVMVGRDGHDGLTYGQMLAVEPPEDGPAPAGGRLYDGVRVSPSAAGRTLPAPRFDVRWAGVVPPRLTAEQYADLWLGLAAVDERVTAAAVDEQVTAGRASGRGWGTGCVLVCGESAVHVRPDGLWVSGDEAVTHTLAQLAAEYIQEWARQRRPRLTELTCRIAPTPDAGADALAVAAAWTTARPVALGR